MKTIGILGSSGAIGKNVVELLRNTYQIKAAYHQNMPHKQAAIIYQQVDVEDKQQVADFIKDCAIVINCAGASYLHGETVAGLVAKQNGVYIDPFGADYLAEKLKGQFQGTFILSCGCFPGMTGIMQKSVMTELDKTEQILGWNPDRHVPSLYGTIDFILSGVNGFGISGSWYENGIEKKDSVNSYMKDMDGYEVRVTKYYTTELRQLVEKYQPDSAAWYTPVLSKALTEKMQTAIWSYMKDRNINILEQSAREICDYVRKNQSNQTDCQIMIRGIGQKNGKTVEKNLQLRTENSSVISAAVITAMVLYLEKHTLKQGSYYGAELLTLEDVADVLKKQGIQFINRQKAVEDKEDDYEEGYI